MKQHAPYLTSILVRLTQIFLSSTSCTNWAKSTFNWVENSPDSIWGSAQEETMKDCTNFDLDTQHPKWNKCHNNWVECHEWTYHIYTHIYVYILYIYLHLRIFLSLSCPNILHKTNSECYLTAMLNWWMMLKKTAKSFNTRSFWSRSFNCAAFMCCHCQNENFRREILHGEFCE